MGWKRGSWKTPADEPSQGRKRTGRGHEEEQGPWERAWETRATAQGPAVPPAQRSREGEGHGPSSSGSGVTTVSQILAQSQIRLSQHDSPGYLQRQLEQVQAAYRVVDTRGHAWDTLRREEVRLNDVITQHSQSEYNPEVQAVLLQREYNEETQKVNACWEKRQRLATEARTVQSHLDVAEREYVASTIVKDKVGAKLQAAFRDVSAHWTRKRKEEAARPLRELAPAATYQTRCVREPMGMAGAAKAVERTEGHQKGDGADAVASVAATAPMRFEEMPSGPPLPKCPVLPKAEPKAEMPSWMDIQQAARLVEDLAPPPTGSVDLYGVATIHAEVEEAVRLAQRSKQCLHNAVVRASIKQRDEMGLVNWTRPLLTPRGSVMHEAASSEAQGTGGGLETELPADPLVETTVPGMEEEGVAEAGDGEAQQETVADRGVMDDGCE